MRSFIKVIIFLGILLVIAGGILFGFAVGTKAFTKDEMLTNVYELKEDFDSFNINISTADLEIRLASDGKNKVECVEKEKVSHEVKVENNILTIKMQDNRKWYQKFLDFDYRKMVVTVYVANKDFKNLNVVSSTGDIHINNKEFTFVDGFVKSDTGNITFSSTITNNLEVGADTGNVDICDTKITNNGTFKATTGNVKLNDVACKDLKANTSTGNITFIKTLVENHLEAQASTGNILLMDSDAEILFLKTSTGNVSGNLLTGKTFKTNKSPEKAKVPNTTGGECKIETSTGNINIEVR